MTYDEFVRYLDQAGVALCLQGGEIVLQAPDAVLVMRTISRSPTAKAPPEERPYDPSKNKVRVVGPTFLPNEETSIDLKHPKGPAYQPVQN